MARMGLRVFMQSPQRKIAGGYNINNEVSSGPAHCDIRSRGDSIPHIKECCSDRTWN
jgi:hypothetical protein